jgi:subfamily B ATP-binding cassette protein MsbA
MSVAVLLTFFFALFRLLPLVQVLNGHRSQWAISRNALDVVAQLLDKRDKPYIVDGHRPLQAFRESIVFEDVGFAYEPGQPVLHDISLTIRQGQTTALVGGSGAGKSTLADLLARLQDPTEGRILLDGVDLREFTLESLRRHLVIVSQSTFLFHDTVRANIAYGLDDVPMDRIRWAAEKANALEFIDAMPDGFETVLGDRGERLSGGQRQRISIARALLRDPEILVLDEATSALDSVSERLVQESLEYLMEGRTVLVIAHRLSTVESADHLVVLEGGRIVEEGSYDDLLARKGHLWEYHRLQFETT